MRREFQHGKHSIPMGRDRQKPFGHSTLAQVAISKKLSHFEAFRRILTQCFERKAIVGSGMRRYGHRRPQLVSAYVDVCASTSACRSRVLFLFFGRSRFGRTRALPNWPW